MMLGNLNRERPTYVVSAQIFTVFIFNEYIQLHGFDLSSNEIVSGKASDKYFMFDFYSASLSRPRQVKDASSNVWPEQPLGPLGL